MIASNINSKDLERYLKTHERLKASMDAAIDLLKKDAPDGKYVIDGDKIFVNVSSYTTKPESEAKMEAHKDYIDIQLMVHGSEIIGFESMDKVKCIQEYTPDFAFYEMGNDYDKVVINDGDFVIIFPDELHAPCIANGEPALAKKIVVKVLY